MASPRRWTPRDLLAACLSLDLELLPPDEWVQCVNSWQPEADPSFAGWLARHGRLNGRQSGVLDRLAQSVAGSEDHLRAVLEYFAPQEPLLEEVSEASGIRAALAALGEATRTIDSSPAEPTDDTAQETAPMSSPVGKAVDLSLSVRMPEDVVESGRGERRLERSARYQILASHAEGGLGRVSVAHDSQIGRNVAFKQIKEAFVGDEGSRRRFLLEAEVTGQLEHPGIVPVYSLAEDEQGQPFYAMRLIQGESLKTTIDRFHSDGRQDDSAERGDRKQKGGDGGSAVPPTIASLEFRQLLARFIDLCQAVDFAHSRGFIHRDLKPANVMLGEYGETLIVDWGLARRLGTKDAAASDDDGLDALPPSTPDATRPGTVVGTPAFMSPEQARGEIDQLGPATDIYSLGTILHTILTGKRPHPSLTSQDLIAAVREGRAAPPRALSEKTPRALNAVCMKAMAARPEDRYASAGELARDIERWLGDEPVSAWTEPLATRSRRWMKRHRTLMATSLVTLVAATISLGVILGVQADANARLREANRNERSAKQDAENQFRVALDAIKQYHNAVTTNFLLGQREFQDLRTELLEAPRDFYGDLTRRLADQARPSRFQRESLFEAHIELASLAEDIGSYEDALDSYTTALQVNTSLLQDDPASSEYQKARARLHIALAHAQMAIGRTREADTHLQEAAGIVERMSDRFPGDRELAAIQVKMLINRSLHFRTTSDYEEAEACLQEAIRMNRRWLEENPDETERMRSLATCLNDYGTLLSDVRRFEEAEQMTAESVAVQEQVMVHEPDNAFAVYRLAGALTNLAYLMQDDERYEEAIEVYQRAEPQFRLLVEEAPNVADFQSGLASTLNNMGLLYASLERTEEAEAMYLETLAIKERLARDFPLSVEYRISLAGGYTNFAGFVLRQGEPEAALEWYDRAIAELDEILAEHPEEGTARFFYRNTHLNRALAHRHLEDYLQAAADYRIALEFNTDPEAVSPFTRRRGHALAQGGEHEAAALLAVELDARAENDADYYDIAFIYALSVTAAAADPDLDDTQREEVTREYVTAAVQALRDMHGTGLVSDEVFANLLANNEYIEPLRGHPLFQELAAEFGAD